MPGSSDVPVRPPPGGFPDPPHHIVSVRDLRNSGLLADLVVKLPRPRLAGELLLRSPQPPLPPPQVAPRAAPLGQSLRRLTFHRRQCSVLAHYRENPDDRHNAAYPPGCRCIVRSAYDHSGGSAIGRRAKPDHSAPRRIAPIRDHCWQSLVGSAQIVPSSRNPREHSESAPTIAP